MQSPASAKDCMHTLQRNYRTTPSTSACLLDVISSFVSTSSGTAIDILSHLRISSGNRMSVPGIVVRYSVYFMAKSERTLMYIWPSGIFEKYVPLSTPKQSNAPALHRLSSAHAFASSELRYRKSMISRYGYTDSLRDTIFSARLSPKPWMSPSPSLTQCPSATGHTPDLLTSGGRICTP